MPEPLKVPMLGTTMAGKTSLLVTMHDYLNQFLQDDYQGDMRIHPRGETIGTLEAAFKELKKAANLPVAAPIKRLIPGTAGVETHGFEISCAGKKVPIDFVDTPGGMLVGQNQSEEFRQVLDKATVLFNVLDAAVLMEGDDTLDDEWNCHDTVAKTLARLYDLDEKPRLTIFVLAKCEKWLHERQKKELLKKFETKHAKALKVLAKHDHAVGVVIPVETMGCVEFSRINKNRETGDREMLFVKRPNAKFQPKYVDQPLLYSIHFALCRFYDADSPLCPNFLKALFAGAFLGELEHLSGHRKEYPIYGNKKWLEL